MIPRQTPSSNRKKIEMISRRRGYRGWWVKYFILTHIMDRWRPTKYTPDMIDKVDDYLEITQDEYKDYIKSETIWANSTWRSKEQKINVKLPTLEWFAKFIWVHTDTLVEWRKQYPNFSVALDKILREQKTRLLDKWLNGDYNPTIAKLILSANHGMKETTVQEQTGKDGWPIQVEISTMTDDELMNFIKSK